MEYRGPYDAYSAFLNIQAGQGGQDSMDWTQMLSRMYMRWAARRGFSVHVVEENTGEAGLLHSIEMKISG